VTELRVLVGDLTQPASLGVTPEVIVNAANRELLAGGGVCGAIFAASGRQQLASACAALGGCATGDAVVTPAFELERRGIRWIIHAVGPVFDAADPDASDLLLASAYRAVLREATALGVSSVAVPAISTGIYGFPAERAAAVAVAALKQGADGLATVYLVGFDEHSARQLRAACEAAGR
jgi:O-acetyl-ADP-ribose deacetylase (regulator of RNase III)